MNWYTISLPLIVFGFVLYSISQKSIPKDANALVAIASAYFIAIISCIVVLFFTGEFKKGTSLFYHQKLLPVVFLGFAIIMIELGFLYAYRTGWKISTASIITGSFTAVALALIGVLWYKEDLTIINIVGIVLSLIGVILINYK